MEEQKAKLSSRRVCSSHSGTGTTDGPLPCLPPAQGSQGCRQPVPRGLVPRGQGSLEQERRWKQYLEDERIALFLQNEEFMKELQRNRDFLLALERGEKCLQKHLPLLFECVPPPVMLVTDCVSLPVASWLFPKQSQRRMRPGWWQGVRGADTGQWAASLVLSRLPRGSPPPARLSAVSLAKPSKIHSKEPQKCPLSPAQPVHPSRCTL